MSNLITIEGRLIISEGTVSIATKKGIYYIPGIITELADGIGLDGSKFARLTFEEIDEKSSRS